MAFGVEFKNISTLKAEKTFLVAYNQQLKESCIKADKMTSNHKELSDNYIKLSSCLLDIATLENSSSLQEGVEIKFTIIIKFS